MFKRIVIASPCTRLPSRHACAMTCMLRRQAGAVYPALTTLKSVDPACDGGEGHPGAAARRPWQPAADDVLSCAQSDALPRQPLACPAASMILCPEMRPEGGVRGACPAMVHLGAVLHRLPAGHACRVHRPDPAPGSDLHPSRQWDGAHAPRFLGWRSHVARALCPDDRRRVGVDVPLRRPGAGRPARDAHRARSLTRGTRRERQPARARPRYRGWPPLCVRGWHAAPARGGHELGHEHGALRAG